MIKFFVERPLLCLSVTILSLAAGAGIAHRTREQPGLAALSAGSQVRLKASRDDWRTAVDLRQATPSRGELVQMLPDGRRLVYTLDARLQRFTQDYLKRYGVPYGGAALVRVSDGSLLTLAGYSARDPQLGASELCLTAWAPAASIFKLVTAGALLEQGIPAATSVCHRGGHRRIDAADLVDHVARGQGVCSTLSDAVAHSVNPVFAKLALRYLPHDNLTRWTRRFGFNQAIPFDMPVQPSVADVPQSSLERARMAAGFWHSELSVLHGATIAGVAATEGLLAWPHLIAEVVAVDGVVTRPRNVVPKRLLSKDAAKTLAQMMRGTTVFGTARRGFRSPTGAPLLSVPVAGKTGSLARERPYLGYSWFVGFAPADRPEVVVSALIGNSPRWRIKAHTLAREMLSQYFRRKKVRRPPARQVTMDRTRPSDTNQTL